MMGFVPWGPEWFGGIMMVFWWALIVLAIVALVRWVSGASRVSREKSAQEILDERYARGELSKEEYTEKRAVIAGRS